MLPQRISVKILAIAAGAAFCAAPVFGQYSWTGAANNDWSNAANWTPSGFPSSGTVDVFFDGPGGGQTTINLDASAEIRNMIFETSSAGAYTIGTAGQQLVVVNNGNVTLSEGVTNDQTIAANIKLGTPYFVGYDTYWANNSSANLTISGATMQAGGNGNSGTLYLGGSGTGINTIGADILANDSMLAVWVNLTPGAGSENSTWQLLGNNTISSVRVGQGTLVVNSITNAWQPSSIGNSPPDAANFQLGYYGDATLRYIGPDTVTDRNFSIGCSSVTTTTFDIPSSTLVFNGSAEYSGNTSLVKTGAGTLGLNGNNTYSGATILSGGTLSVMTIADGGKVSGLGKSSADAGNLVFDGGTLQYTGSVRATTDRAFSITYGKMAGLDVLGDLTFNGSVTFTTGGIQVSGGGILTLTGNNQYTGPTLVTDGTTLAVTGSSGSFGGPLGILSEVTLAGNATLDMTNAGAVTIGGLGGEAGTIVFFGDAPPSGPMPSTLTINSANDTTFAGAIKFGANIVKQGGGTLTLTGENWWNGTTTVGGGAMVISGADGYNNATSGIVLSGGGALIVENFGNATISNRLGNGTAVTSSGGTLAFRTDATTPNVSNSLGALTLTAGANTIENGQAAAGNSSTLTFASLTRTGSASVNFVGTGLGLSDRNRIFFTEAPTLGDWAIYNGVGYATYNGTLGVMETLYADVTRGSSGQKTIYNAADEIIRIIDGTGTAGAIELGGGGDHPPSPPPPEPATTLTNIHSIVQTAAGGPVTINVAGNQIFQTMSILGGNGSGALTIGTAPNVGKISSSDMALNSDLRRFSLINHSDNPMVINSTIGNAWIFGGPEAIALVKSGPGTVVLAGNNTYDGTTTIAGGVLGISLLANAGQASNLGLAPGVAENIVFEGGTLLYTGGNASTDRGFTVNGAGSRIETSASLHFTGNYGIVLAAGDLTIGGAGNTTISTVISGGGSLGKDGASTLTLDAANTFTGSVTVRGGAVSVANISNLGAAPADPANLVLDGGSLVVTTGEVPTGRGMSITANGGTLVQSNAAANTVFFGSDITIAHGGVFTVDGPGWVTLQNGITGPGSLRKSGDGYLRLEDPVNLFTGSVTISAGSLGIAGISNGGQPGYLGAASADPANLVFDGGTLSLFTIGTTQTTDRGFSIAAGKTATFMVANNSSLRFSGAVPVTTGGLTMAGNGVLILAGNMAFAGAARVNAGTLVIDGTLGPGTYPSDSVYAAAGAVLGGSGTIRRDVYISGTHSPGSSPGIQTIGGAVVYNAGATVEWELVASTTDGRGTNYDGINGNGSVAHFLGSTAMNLVFNLPGSTVKWSDGLWGANRQWVVYSGFVPVGFENFTLTPTNWADSTGMLFNDALPDSTFTLTQSGQDIILNYTGVPEPSTGALLALGALALLCRWRMATSIKKCPGARWLAPRLPGWRGQ
jgi:fibronectin-binding autotransporter adhesin